MHDFFKGIKCFLDGLLLLTQPGIKRFVIIPATINIILFVILFSLLSHLMRDFNVWFMHLLPAWLHWLSYMVWVLFAISFFLTTIASFITITNLLAAPFNSLLSEHIENSLTQSIPPPATFGDTFKAVPRAIGRQLAIICYYLPRALLILVLFLVPIIHAVAPLLWFMFNGWFMALTYCDYPSDNHHQSFKEMRIIMRRQPLRYLGFGTAVLLVSIIPILNLLVIPAATAGATKLWLQRDR